jgi:hypothetical protein
MSARFVCTCRIVLALYRRESVNEDRALGLLMGTFEPDGLPDLPPVAEGEPGRSRRE